MEIIQTEILVIGSGPGGITAAFYAADKGKEVVLVEQDERLGGVCLHRGCIPSKSLITATKVIREARKSGERGISFGDPQLNVDKLRDWKNSILSKLSQGLQSLADRRRIGVVHGRAKFRDSNSVIVQSGKNQTAVQFKHAIIACGSMPASISGCCFDGKQFITSNKALDVPDIPGQLLVIGGGYIGMEIGSVYAALGSEVTVVEALGGILSGADPDLVRPVFGAAEHLFKKIRLQTKVTGAKIEGSKIKASMASPGGPIEEFFDKVLIAVGRKPSTAGLGLEMTQARINEKGFLIVDENMRTSDPCLYAIGDAAGGLLLAHKASKEARIAVEAIAGEKKTPAKFVLPCVVYTDPELAWCGVTETEARAQNLPAETLRFPWSASGRALTMDRTDGMTKLIVDKNSGKVLGAGIVGAGAGELIGEMALAIEMGATAQDLARTVHPHPTLSETIGECASMFYGDATNIYSRPRNAK